MQVGRKIFYEKITGNVLVDTGERSGSVVPTTVEQDRQIFTALSERSANSYDVLELEYGAYSQDFIECNGYRVNIATKTLEFSYPNPSEPTIEQPYEVALSEKLAQLEVAQAVTDTTLLELMESLLQ